MRVLTLVASVTCCWLGAANAQLITAYTGDEPPPKMWIIDVTTGDDVEGPLGKSRALASDPTTNRIFEIEDRSLGRTSVSLRISTVDASGRITQGSPRLVVDDDGIDIRFIRSLAFGNGTLYAASSGNSRAGVPGSLGTIDLETYVYTPLPTSNLSPGASAMTFDHDRNQLLLGSIGSGSNPNRIFAFDPETGESELVVELPPEEGDFDGLAYGYQRIWMDCGASNACGDISVFNRITGAFEAPLDTPNRFGNGSGGATFLATLAVIPPCGDGLDNDGDGEVDHPADPGCDSPDDASEKAEGAPSLPCDNGLDDDGDGWIDFDPTTFASPGDATTDPAGGGDPGCAGPSAPTEAPACQNGIDDADGDDAVDFDGGRSVNGVTDPAGPDPQCIGRPWRNRETTHGCGIGSEIALLLPALAYLRGRRVRW